LLLANICHSFSLGASFEAFVTVMIQVQIFFFVTPYNVVVGYQRFRGQGEDGGSTDWTL
jgi:hypothetical protein